MLCLDDHHHYQVESFEGSQPQNLLFIKKEKLNDAGELKTVQDGTTNEEVLKVLIHRLNGLNTKFPCRENAIAITHIETALLFLEKRTRNRVERGVEGKHQK